jgi:hypothetical protein
MKLELYPTMAGIWALHLGDSFDHFLCKELLSLHQSMTTGTEIWDRRPHDIFDGSVSLATMLAREALPVLQRDFIGPKGRITSLQGREVVRTRGVEIMPHSDEDECHLQAVYFPNGPELDPGQSLQSQVNQYGPNAFAICNPDWRSSGFGKRLMPWEQHAKYWIKPHRGLLVAFDARAVHFQKPYPGDPLREDPFVQVLLNIKVERIDG